jgi:hypothetical protein
LILLRPSFGLLDYVFEDLRDHTLSISHRLFFSHAGA